MIRPWLMLAILLGLSGCAEPVRDRPAPGDPGSDRGRSPEITPKRIEMH